MKLEWLDISKKEIEIDQDSQYVYLFVGKEGDKLESDLKFIQVYVGRVRYGMGDYAVIDSKRDLYKLGSGRL